MGLDKRKMRNRIVSRRHSLGVFHLPLPKLLRCHAAFIRTVLRVRGVAFKQVASGDGFPDLLESFTAVSVVEISGNVYYAGHAIALTNIFQ
jgi:hypothetical protein